MNLDDAQKKTVAQWIENGAKLSEIQSRLASEFGINLTYMDIRFLVDDLKLVPKDQPVPPAPVLPKPAPAPAPAPARAAARPPEPGADTLPGEEATDELLGEPGVPGAPTNVQVGVDTIPRPGTMVSGTVTFSDGETATWQLDQYGRLGLGAKQPGYRPAPADLQAFQTELHNQLQKMGY